MTETEYMEKLAALSAGRGLTEEQAGYLDMYARENASDVDPAEMTQYAAAWSTVQMVADDDDWLTRVINNA